MQDDPSLAIAVPILLIVVFLIVGFIGQEIHPVMSGPDGSVITITESEYQSSSGETFGGDVFVAVLDNVASAAAEMALMCCSGGALFWIGLVVIVFAAIFGIGAAAG